MGGDGSGGVGRGAEDEDLEGQSGAEADEESEVAALAQRRRAHLQRSLPDLVQDEEHRGARHIAVLGQDVPAALHLVVGKLQLRLDLVQDGGASGVHGPEHVVPVGGARAFASLSQEFLDVLGDQPGDVLHEVEDEAGFGEMAVDGAIALGEDGLARPVDFEERLLLGLGVGSHDVHSSAVAEQSRSHEPVEVIFARGAVRHGRDFAAHSQNPSALVVLREVLGHPEHGCAAEAASLVHHDALHAGLQAQQLRQRVVGAGHVDAAGGGEHDVGDLGLLAAPLLDSLHRGLSGELGHLHHDDVVTHVERGLHVGADAGVSLQHLLRQEHVALPDPGLVTCN